MNVSVSVDFEWGIVLLSSSSLLKYSSLPSIKGVAGYPKGGRSCPLGCASGHCELCLGDNNAQVWMGIVHTQRAGHGDSVAPIRSYPQQNPQPLSPPYILRLPSLAVAAGAHIYIYRNLRPYYKVWGTACVQCGLVWNTVCTVRGELR